MKAEYLDYLAQLDETLGIREFDTYEARVISETQDGCYLRANGIKKDIFIKARYPILTELMISFNIYPWKRKYYPVVETVLHHGYDIDYSHTNYTVA